MGQKVEKIAKRTKLSDKNKHFKVMKLRLN